MGCYYCGSLTRKLIAMSASNGACTTCLRERKKLRKAAGQERRARTVYGITLAQKKEVIEFQGGGCICYPWTGYNGNSRALSTDHDHKTGEVRGELCKHCNDLLGRIRDDPEYFRRMLNYLANPPAKRLFGSRVVPGHEG